MSSLKISNQVNKKMKFDICVKVDEEFRTIELDNIRNIFFRNPIMIFDTICTDKVRVYLTEENEVKFEFGGTKETPTWITLEIS